MDSIFSINQDSFIYSVRQAFEARSKPNGEFNSHIKYTPFLENTWKKPEESSISALKQPIQDIVQHHWTAIPHYQRHDKVTLENIAWFAHSIAALFADIEYLLKNVLNHGIPQKDDESPESAELWSLITTSVQNVFHEYAELFNAYAQWKYVSHSEAKEATDWNVRPPCGMLYRTEFKALFDEIRNARFGNKSSKPHSRDKGKIEHENKDKNEKASAHKAEHQSKDHKPRAERNHQDRGERNHQERRNHDKREPKRALQHDEKSLQPALDECKQAIETLKNNINIHEIPLSAQNSFVRRHQHTLITEAGLDTDSRGEGANRHVCIIRKQ